MEIRVEAGGIQSTKDELIVVNLFEGVEKPGGATGAVDQALGGAIREAIADGDLRGKLGEVAVFYPRGAIPASRVVVVGLGPQDRSGRMKAMIMSCEMKKNMSELSGMF